MGGGLLTYGKENFVGKSCGAGNSFLKNGNYMFLDKHCISGKLGYAVRALYVMGCSDVLDGMDGMDVVDWVDAFGE